MSFCQVEVPGLAQENHHRGRLTSLPAIDQRLKKILNTRVISGLDAVRALAVSLVLTDHFLLTDHLFGFHPQTGSLGVMMFFVLSGFLITSMLLKEYGKSGTIGLRNFYRRRAYRIFPTFYCCWILTTLVDFLVHQLQWKTAAISFFYMMDYGRALAPANVQPWMHMWVSWSLAVEEKFYLLWPLLLLFLLRRPNVLRVLASVILGQWTYRAILYLGFHVSSSYVYCTFDMRVDALLVGCLLALLVANDATRLVCCNLLRWQALAILPVLTLLAEAAYPPHNPAVWLLLWSLEPVMVAILLLQFVYWGAQSWAVCASRPVRLMAQLSYALYLYHPLAGKIVKVLGLHHLGIYAFALMLVMAAASYYLVERPFMRLRDRERPAIASAIAPVRSLV